MEIIEKGDLFYADVGATIELEKGGLIPVVIIQNDIANKYAPTVIVAAISSQINKAKLPTHVEVSADKYGLNRDSVILLEHIRTLNKRRLKEKINKLTINDIEKLDEALNISFNLEKNLYAYANNKEIKDINKAIRFLNSIAKKYDLKEHIMEDDYEIAFKELSNDVTSIFDEIKNVYSVVSPLVEKQKIAKGKLTEYAVIEYFKNNHYESKKASIECDALKIDVISKNNIDKIFIQVKAGQISAKEITKLVKNISELDDSYNENGLKRVAGVCADRFPPNSDIIRMRLEKQFDIPIMFIHKYQILKLQPEFKSTIN